MHRATALAQRGLAAEANLGLARISYEWNDLDAAQEHGQQCLQLTRQGESVDTFASYAVFLARLRLAQNDVPGAVAILHEAEEFLRQHNFAFRMADVAAAQVLTLLRQGHLAAAAHLAETHQLPLGLARIHLAMGDTSAALAVLEPWRRQVEDKGWRDERLKVMILKAVALGAHADGDAAVQQLQEALALAEPGGFIRSFVDEGIPMARLLHATAAHGRTPDYIAKLLTVFGVGEQTSADTSDTSHCQPLIEPLSQRELEVLPPH